MSQDRRPVEFACKHGSFYVRVSRAIDHYLSGESTAKPGDGAGFVRCPTGCIRPADVAARGDASGKTDALPRGRWRQTEEELKHRPDPTEKQNRARARNWTIHQVKGLYSTLTGLSQVARGAEGAAINYLCNENREKLREARRLIGEVFDNIERGVV